jgi:hypothetical protein
MTYWFFKPQLKKSFTNKILQDTIFASFAIRGFDQRHSLRSLQPRMPYQCHILWNQPQFNMGKHQHTTPRYHKELAKFPGTAKVKELFAQPRITCMLDSSSLIRDMIRTQPSVALVNPEFDIHTSRIILITRLRTLTPVSIMRSAIFSKYYNHQIHNCEVKSHVEDIKKYKKKILAEF